MFVKLVKTGFEIIILIIMPTVATVIFDIMFCKRGKKNFKNM